MKKRAKKQDAVNSNFPMTDEEIDLEQARAEILKPRSKYTGPVPLDVKGNDHEREAEELERQGYTENGLDNPPYTNDEAIPDERDGHAPKQWKIA